MKLIKEIDINLENCEFITINAEYIKDILIDDIYTSIVKCGCNGVAEFIYADKILLVLSEEAKSCYKPIVPEEDGMITTFDRLTEYHDIVSISVRYLDNTETEYLANYKDEIDDMVGAANLNQKSYIDEQGNLCITIEGGV